MSTLGRPRLPVWTLGALGPPRYASLGRASDLYRSATVTFTVYALLRLSFGAAGSSWPEGLYIRFVKRASHTTKTIP